MKQLFGICLIVIMVAAQSCTEAPKNEKSEIQKVAAELADDADAIFGMGERMRQSMMDVHRFRNDNAYDSLARVNSLLIDYLKEKCAEVPGSIQVNFEGLDTLGMNILTSDDNNFRIYCWNTETGGTMRFFNALIQYRSEGQTAVAVLNDIAIDDNPGSLYREIHTIQAGGRSYYLAISRGIFSSRDVVEGIKAYTIEDGRLNDSVKLFRTSKQQLNEISYACNFFSNVDENTGSQKNLIRLSDDKQSLFIPIVNDKDEVTDKTLVYKFDGNNFVFDKNAR